VGEVRLSSEELQDRKPLAVTVETNWLAAFPNNLLHIHLLHFYNFSIMWNETAQHTADDHPQHFISVSQDFIRCEYTQR